MSRSRPQQQLLQNPSIDRNMSSSSFPDPLDSFNRQIHPRQNERRITENKLIPCPSCKKDIPEREFAAHLDSERLDKDFIPCVSCGWTFPINRYGQHVEQCRRTDRTGRQRQNSEDSHRVQPVEVNRESHDPENESEGCLTFLSRFFGVHHEENTENESIGNRPETTREDRQQQQRSHQQQSHSRNASRQAQRAQTDANRLHVIVPDPFMIQGNRNALIPISRPTTRTIRTVEMGPGGTLLIRTHEIPAYPMQTSAAFQMNSGFFGPMGMIFNIFNAGFPGSVGTMVLGDGELEHGHVRNQGLNKEVLNNMSVVKYNPIMDKNVDPETRTCPICLDQYEEGQELRFLWCMHRFHRECVDSWLEKHTNCPICKKDFSESQNGFSS